MEADVEMLPLRSTDSPPPMDCIICLTENERSKPDDIRIPICPRHNNAVHMRCLPRLMGKGWHVDCPNTFEECSHFKPQLIVGDIKINLDYSIFTVKRSFYIGWIFAVVFGIALNVFATFSINECDLRVYQNSCYISGLLTHGIASLILVLLFFYYRPTVVTYFKYDHDYGSIKRKLYGEMFILSLAAASNVPLLVLIGEVLETHLILGVWIAIVSGIINPLACIAVGHNLYEILLHIGSAEIVFTETEVRSLEDFHQVPKSAGGRL
jgi:hypothetical protein